MGDSVTETEVRDGSPIDIQWTQYTRNLRIGGAGVTLRIVHELGEFDLTLPIKPPLPPVEQIEDTLKGLVQAFAAQLSLAAQDGIAVPDWINQKPSDPDQEPSET